MKAFFMRRGIRYAMQDVPDSWATDWIGYVYVECFWCENDGFEELLKSLGLEYAKSDYEMRIYKTQGNRPKQKVKKSLEIIVDKIADYIDAVRDNQWGRVKEWAEAKEWAKEMAICRKK